MERRIGQLAGLLGFVLIIARLDRLLLSGDQYPQWRLILIASAVLGGVIWWLLNQLSRSRWLTIGSFTVLGGFLFLRVAVPDTLTVVLPTSETWPALSIEMDRALGLIRSGVPPISPEEGVIAILSVLIWVIGALYVWGLSGGPIAASVIPVMVVYLQFAVFDREEAGFTWLVLSASMIGMAVTALGLERKREAGRARDVDGRPKARRSMVWSLSMAGVVAVLAVAISTAAADTIDEYGYYSWRDLSGGGFGEGGGGTYDPFVELSQRVLNPSDTVMFTARLGPGSPPPTDLYWRMDVLDRFDGERWAPSWGDGQGYEPDRDLTLSESQYLGATEEVLQMIAIGGLREDLVPTVGVLDRIDPLDPERHPNAIDPTAFKIADNSSLVYEPRLGAGDTYQISGVLPRQELDLAALATDQATGALSPLFAAAVADGALDLEPTVAPGNLERPDDFSRYTDLPEPTPSSLTVIALLRTRGAATDFERAWLLESWFTDLDEFQYSTNVTTGSSSLILEEWLSEEDSLNYRTGYCEQFATAMAVLGRTLGIPSRVVWGFTPGSLDGNTIVVRDRNAHAWVEMWIDGVGWVQFDPTPPGAEPRPDPVTATADLRDYLPDSATDSGDALLPEPTVPGFVDDAPELLGGTASRELNWIPIVVLVVVVILVTPPAIKRARKRRRILTLRDGDITAAWEELVDRLDDLGQGVPADLTPMEYANRTDGALVALASGYSATVYGGQENRGEESHMYAVDGYVDGRFDRLKRAKAALNLRSLIKRR